MLFDKNGFYMLSPENTGYDFAIDIMTGNDGSMDIYNIDEAFRRGNSFPKLYTPYKNYEPSAPRVTTEREKCLLEIQKLDFMITDLNLYLDVYPDDVFAYNLFKKYVMECKKRKEEYAKIYGPLVLEDLTDEYEWSTGVWPWEGSGM